MHYIGKEQHHGYENRLTPDIYPADFGWTVDWDKPDERQEWYHNMSSVLQAGIAVRTNQLDYDEEVMFKSTQYLYDHVRSTPESRRPFFLTVSMTHPHDPYAISKKYWDRYADVDIPAPAVPAPAQETQDPHSKRLLKVIDLWNNPLPEEAIVRARRAYFGACSYVDDQVGKLMEVLNDCGLAEDTIVVFTSDHGDMLGERGLWYKMSWFENSARVPLVVNYPANFKPRRVSENVSTMDLLPSFVDMARGRPAAPASDSTTSPLSSSSASFKSQSSTFDLIDGLDGKSFYPALHGLPIHDEAIGEYMGEGTVAPLIMIKRGHLKYVTSPVDPPQLFDLSVDPLEKVNLATRRPELLLAFQNEVAQRWDLKRLHRQVLRSQRQRQLCWEALTKGKFESWDYEPQEISGGRYIRSNIPLDELEIRARYPPVDKMGHVVTKRLAGVKLASQASGGKRQQGGEKTKEVIPVVELDSELQEVC
jgi:arylsulfatase A-like enzyme